MITLGKNRLNKLDNNGIDYQINYRSCDSTYIGMGKRKQKTRLMNILER